MRRRRSLPAAAWTASWNWSFARAQVPDWESSVARAEELLGLAQLAQVLVGDPGRGERGRHALELGAHLVALAHVAHRRAAHDRALVGHELDRPRGLELAQRLADRGAAEAVLGGQLLLAQARTGGKVAGDDPGLDRLREVVDDAPAAPGREIACLPGPRPEHNHWIQLQRDRIQHRGATCAG